jgi:hypothetical protein
MSDSTPKRTSLPAALLRYGGAALFHFAYWLVYLNLGWPFDDLRTFYPPDQADGTYFAKMAVTAGIGIVGLAAISVAAQRWRERGRNTR